MGSYGHVTGQKTRSVWPEEQADRGANASRSPCSAGKCVAERRWTFRVSHLFFFSAHAVWASFAHKNAHCVYCTGTAWVDRLNDNLLSVLCIWQTYLCRSKLICDWVFLSLWRALCGITSLLVPTCFEYRHLRSLSSFALSIVICARIIVNWRYFDDIFTIACQIIVNWWYFDDIVTI